MKFVENLLYMVQVFFNNFPLYKNLIQLGYGKG